MFLFFHFFFVAETFSFRQKRNFKRNRFFFCNFFFLFCFSFEREQREEIIIVIVIKWVFVQWRGIFTTNQRQCWAKSFTFSTRGTSENRADACRVHYFIFDSFFLFFIVFVCFYFVLAVCLFFTRIHYTSIYQSL